MTTEVKSELKKNGFVVIQSSYYLIGIFVLVIGIAIGVGKTLESQNDIADKVEKLDVWKLNHEKESTQIRIDLERRLSSMEQKLDWLIKHTK
jgi:uncharacterized protein involved in cysteine biosynthesis